jgi:hypothetical protein
MIEIGDGVITEYPVEHVPDDPVAVEQVTPPPAPTAETKETP